MLNELTLFQELSDIIKQQNWIYQQMKEKKINFNIIQHHFQISYVLFQKLNETLFI